MLTWEELNLLQLNNIDVSYDKYQVIWNVSLHVNKGETVALIGPNGSGKSTILNTISNLVNLQQGEIIFNDSDIYIDDNNFVIGVNPKRCPGKTGMSKTGVTQVNSTRCFV